MQPIIGIGEQCLQQVERIESLLARISANDGVPTEQLLELAEAAQMAVSHFGDLAREALHGWRLRGGDVKVLASEMIIRLVGNDK
jgi:hypothetical protein